MANNIIINQALDALRASLPVGDVVSTTAVKVNCTNENDVTVKIMNIDFVCHVRENITKATLNPTLATMQTMNNDKQQILLVTQTSRRRYQQNWQTEVSTIWTVQETALSDIQRQET